MIQAAVGRRSVTIAPTRRFAPADCIAPSWKPKGYFFTTKREVHGRVGRCRTGHAFIGEDYAKFVLRECELYEQHRDILRDASAELTIPDLLGTEDGIQAVVKFLDAFTKRGQRRRETEPWPPAPEEECNDEDSEEGSEDGYGEDESKEG
ncbi:hypothetical protein B0H16DRAFT_1490170 [Mycena metata]|uniref:Uncharacterized protein n=1 Tax=Mycena metata TaxID=1033252 RepID=A0AAD7KJM0_9AGAR|nr:hypothetical protein B0H16DRAFT_1490170 [Mycena metata]